MAINLKTRFNFFVLALVVFAVISSCAAYNLSEQEMNGVYKLKDNKAIQLKLEKNSFLFVDTYKQEHLPPFKCCDTIAYGSWHIDKKVSLIELSSPEILNDSYVYLDVEEKIQPSLDSISFIIENPIEKHYKKFGEKYREVLYSIILTTDNDFLIETSDKNPLKVKKVDGLKTVEIVIYPKYDIPIREISTREVYTLPYNVQKPDANTFKVNIPQLDYGYLSYRRLNKDYIKIINKNKLLWDGKEYLKQ